MTPDLGKVEKRVLRALREQPSATAEQIAEMLQDTGASSVVEAKAALAKNGLVEPAPDIKGAMRLTSEGEKLADELPATKMAPGSGGGDSSFN